LGLNVGWYRDVLRAKLVSLRLPRRLLLDYKAKLSKRREELELALGEFGQQGAHREEPLPVDGHIGGQGQDHRVAGSLSIVSSVTTAGSESCPTRRLLVRLKRMACADKLTALTVNAYARTRFLAMSDLKGAARAVGMQSGADILVQCLINHGVETVFAYPGGPACRSIRR